MRQKVDLINGKPGQSMFLFALPMIAGNLFQQFYNMADSIIVGRFVGEDALAAVGPRTLSPRYLSWWPSVAGWARRFWSASISARGNMGK